MILRRGRFRDVVERQLELFADDERELLAEAATADETWTDAERDQTEELYGDYQLLVDAIAERLYDLREAYAATLDDGAADEYRRAFTNAAARRYPRYSSFLDDR